MLMWGLLVIIVVSVRGPGYWAAGTARRRALMATAASGWGELCFEGWVCFPGERNLEASVDRGEVRGWWGAWLLQGWRGRVQEEKLRSYGV